MYISVGRTLLHESAFEWQLRGRRITILCMYCMCVCIYMCIPLKPEYGDAGQRSFSATGEGNVLTAPYTKHVLVGYMGQNKILG